MLAADITGHVAFNDIVRNPPLQLCLVPFLIVSAVPADEVDTEEVSVKLLDSHLLGLTGVIEDVVAGQCTRIFFALRFVLCRPAGGRACVSAQRDGAIRRGTTTLGSLTGRKLFRVFRGGAWRQRNRRRGRLS